MLITAGCAALVLVVLTLVMTLSPLLRILLAVAVAIGVGAALGGPARDWLPSGFAAGFFGYAFALLWELLVVAGDVLRATATRRRPPTSSQW